MSPNFERRPRLHGREAECETLAGLAAGLRRGQGAVLSVTGEPGIGKTALLEFAAGLAGDLRVLQAVGTESETALPYAGLHQLCGALTGQLGRLPEPQRVALETVFGRRAGPADRFLVGLGVLSLLTEVAADGPLLCLIDDAHWLDQASGQALAFAARRLAGQPVLMIFTVRAPVTDLAGLPELVLDGLRDADARDLLGAAVRWPLDERVREQIVAEARGNPRMLLELRDVSPAELAGGYRLPSPPPGGITGPVRGQLGQLSLPARRLLLAAAADPTGDPARLWRATAELGIASEAALAAAEAGLISVGNRVLFRDRLVRSAAYHDAPLRDRRAAHQALARATDPATDPDGRAWHQAQAGHGPDEKLAAELERTAPRARARGGLAAAAAFLERAAVMTPDPGRRAERTLDAAAVMLQAGEPGAVARLLAVADAGLPGDHQRARADLVRARLAARQRGAEVPWRLLDAARRLDRSDTAGVRAAYLDAIRAATFAGGLAAPGGTVAEVARAARKAPDADGPGPADLLLDGLAALLSEEYAAGGPALRQALDELSVGLEAAELHWLPLACMCARALWADSAWDILTSQFVRLAREQGAVAELPLALNLLACRHLVGGDLATAGSLAEEARVTAAATGSRSSPYGALGLAALRGRREVALPLIDEVTEDAARRGEGSGAAAAQWAAAVLHNGLGQYEAALAAAEEAIRYAGPSILSGWPAAELIEAAARAGLPGRALEAMSTLSRMAGATDSDWALGVRARSLALLSDTGSAEPLYQAAIRHLSQSRDRVGLARAHLLYGEWLRRENRRVDAREQLHRAHQLLSAIGADGFAERARRELLATGETVRRRRMETDRDLTAQELQIAVRAQDGQTNTEIGAELFLSPRTVEWHLRKVFTKLGITSRRQLQHALPGADPAILGR
ncbi:MAG: AAA family ATPase [Actinobacteria bacterium]|nr:AAA family ATPase [Actinomycetota bacterium]